MLPLHIDADGSPRFADFVTSNSAVLDEAIQHKAYPFSLTARMLRPGTNPLQFSIGMLRSRRVKELAASTINSARWSGSIHNVPIAPFPLPTHKDHNSLRM